jgi:MFS family permease
VPLGRRLTLVLGVTQLLAWATTYYTPAVVTAAASRSMQASPTALLGGFSWALLITGFASPRVGRRIDRIGGRGVLAFGNAVMAAGMMILTAWPTLAGWYVGWTICGFGMAAGLYDASFATIGRLLGAAARPAIVGVTLFGGFASSLGWPMGVGLVRLVDWRATVAIYALILVGVNVPLILAIVPRAPVQATTAETSDRGESSPARGSAAFLLLAIFFSLRSAISSVVSVHALALFRGLGLAAGAAVGVAALIGPMQVAGRVLEVAFGRRLDPLVTSWLGAGLLPAGVAVMLTGAPVGVFAVAYGMSNGILTISRGTLPLHLFGARGYATRIGRLALPVMLAQAAAPTAVTPLVLAWPARWLFAVMGATAAMALLCLLPLNRLTAAARD